MHRPMGKSGRCVWVRAQGMGVAQGVARKLQERAASFKRGQERASSFKRGQGSREGKVQERAREGFKLKERASFKRGLQGSREGKVQERARFKRGLLQERVCSRTASDGKKTPIASASHARKPASVTSGSALAAPTAVPGPGAMPVYVACSPYERWMAAARGSSTHGGGCRPAAGACNSSDASRATASKKSGVTPWQLRRAAARVAQAARRAERSLTRASVSERSVCHLRQGRCGRGERAPG